MPIFRNKVLAGSEFDGTSDAGLFLIPRVGPANLQVRINNLYFHTSVACDAFLGIQDPTDPDNLTIILAVTAAKDVVSGGFLVPTEASSSWPLLWVTDGMTGDGWLTIDYDLQVTEG